MPKTKRTKAPHPFKFPTKAHCRLHGPGGLTDYRNYKPWLRDEFEFRCVYCLTRELWTNDGPTSFTIDHVKPKSLYPKLQCEYDNLVYACTWCNSHKSNSLGFPDPCATSLAEHVRYRSNMFYGITPKGRRLVKILDLNAKGPWRFRGYFLRLFEGQSRFSRAELDLFCYPDDLPDLSPLKPPKGNRRPAGIKQSHYARKKVGLLPEYY
jgi:hypothetical protein